MGVQNEGSSGVPWALCASLVVQIAELDVNPLSALKPSFALQALQSDRKRAVGTGRICAGHRQADSAHKVRAAGYQLKRGAAKPLLELEMEPWTGR